MGTRNSNPCIRNRLELYFGWRKQKPLQTFDVDTAHMYTAAASFSRMLNIISLPYNKMFSIKKTTHSYGTKDRLTQRFHARSGTMR